mgnify:CR=1 FL=1
MKNRKTYLLRGLLVLLAAALVLAAALPGLGLSTGGPTPLPQAQADPLRPEGQSQSPQTPPDQPEEPDAPQGPDTPDEPQEPEQPDTPDQPDQPDDGKQADKPATGDSLSAGWLALTLFSGATAACMVLLRRKKDD